MGLFGKKKKTPEENTAASGANDARTIKPEGAVTGQEYVARPIKQQTHISYSDGVEYDGEVSDGKQDGYGKMVFTNGDTVTGYFKSGAYHGVILYTFANGDKQLMLFNMSKEVERLKVERTFAVDLEKYRDDDMTTFKLQTVILDDLRANSAAGAEDTPLHAAPIKPEPVSASKTTDSVFGKMPADDKPAQAAYSNGNGLNSAGRKSNAVHTHKDEPKSGLMSADEAFDIAEAFYVQKKYNESNRYYKIAADQGHARALNCLGCSYRFGEGVDEDIPQALRYYEASYAGGFIKAGGSIGQIYYDGEGGIKCDYDKAFPLLLQSAMAGIGFPMTTLSDAYYYGNGCEENEKLAAYWAYQAIKHENDYGYYWLGMYFDEGIFFTECPAAAKYCFEKAVEQDFDADEYLESDKYLDIDAVEPDFIVFNDDDPSFFTQECPFKQYLRALCLLDGKDNDGKKIKVDVKGGLKLLEQAARQGYSEAQYSLGAKYLNTADGGGVRYNKDGSVLSLGCDTQKALHYLDLAARQGHPEALDALTQLYCIGDTDIEQDPEKSDEYKRIKYKLFQNEEDCPDDDDDSDDDDDDEFEEDEDEDEQGRHLAHIDYEGGDCYDGEVENDVRNGRGIYTFTSGASYEGDFADDLFEGHGKFIHADGSVHEGEYKNDKLNGSATYSNPDGDTYTGDYLDGERCGYGEEYNASTGTTYKGIWRNGNWNGIGRADYGSGGWYFGQFSDGKSNGYGVYFDGTIYCIGYFEDNTCVTVENIKKTMRHPVLNEIGDGATCYCDVPEDVNGYTIYRGNGNTLYVKNNGSWVARYSTASEMMEMGAVDRKSRLNEDLAVTVYIDKMITVGKVTAGVPSGKTVIHYVSGETIECEYRNGKIDKMIQLTDKFGRIKE